MLQVILHGLYESYVGVAKERRKTTYHTSPEEVLRLTPSTIETKANGRQKTCTISIMPPRIMPVEARICRIRASKSSGIIVSPNRINLLSQCKTLPKCNVDNLTGAPPAIWRGTIDAIPRKNRSTRASVGSFHSVIRRRWPSLIGG